MILAWRVDTYGHFVSIQRPDSTWHPIKHPRFFFESELDTLARMGRRFYNPLLKPLLQIDAVITDDVLPLTGANFVTLAISTLTPARSFFAAITSVNFMSQLTPPIPSS